METGAVSLLLRRRKIQPWACIVTKVGPLSLSVWLLTAKSVSITIITIIIIVIIIIILFIASDVMYSVKICAS